MCGQTILIKLLKKIINHLKNIIQKTNMTKNTIIKIKFLKNVKQKIYPSF